MENNFAAYIENAFKAYDRKQILNNFSMHVPKGVIYGLLGPSGCGKTTLLNCIVGNSNLDAGKVCVLGNRLDLNEVPISRIGYMPQDIGLSVEFTVSEAVFYFGKIFGIRLATIKERLNKLSQLLDLPPDHKLIRECSGGEQRRVSFAAALINNPELLILDEPTVGLDPVLREIMWNYLLELVKLKNTVIITTHYIEEARQAHQVGFMRGGKLLAEDAPEKLLSLYRVDSLEKVFLVLSTKRSIVANSNQNENTFHSDTLRSGSPTNNTTKLTTKNSTCRKENYCKKSLLKLSLNINRLKALFSKNFIQLSRNKSGTIFTFLFPVLAMLTLLIAVGDDIRNIEIAIVNDEYSASLCKNRNVSVLQCGDQHLSCKFIEELEDPMIDRNFFDRIDDALNELHHGNVWGVVHIPANFSEAFLERIEAGPHASQEILNASQIIAWVDISNKQIGNSIKLKLSEKVLHLQDYVLKECNYESSFANSIVQLRSTLYGNKNDKFTIFIIPGMLLTVAFFMSVTNTVDTIITDKLGGTWHRSAAAGVSSLEIILTHFVTQFFIVVIQITELLVLTFFIYKAEYEGNLIEIVVILLMGSIAGMFYGFWISVVCKNYSVANFLTTGSFYPLVLLSGVLWPLEGMSKILQYFALGLPIALPTLSLRNIMKKGWNLGHLEVLNGIGVQVLWIVLLGTICVYQLRNKR